MQLRINNQSNEQFKVSLMYLSVITLVTVISWIGFSVYRTYMTSSIDPEVKKMIQAINPTLDIASLTKYKTSRISLPDQFQIIAVTKQNNQSAQTIIDPFTNQVRVVTPVASTSAFPVASTSAEMIP